MQCIECGSIWDLQDERCYDCNSRIDWSANVEPDQKGNTMNNTTANVATFEAGRTYATRSACDHECIFRYTVTRRTDKSVWIKEAAGNRVNQTAQVTRRRIEVWNGSEMIYPDGKYSMCPIIRAENVEPDQKGGEA